VTPSPQVSVEHTQHPERLPHELYSIKRVGVVGSYVKAKQGGYSRGPKYWAICKFSDECGPNCRFKERDRFDAHYPKGPIEDPAFRHFRTKTLALAHLLEWANGNLPGGPFEDKWGYGIAPVSPGK